MLQGASESYLASLSCLCQAIFFHILAACWADLLCQPAKQGSLQLFVGSWRGSGSTIFQRCSLGSCGGCALLCPKMLQGASEWELLSQSVLPLPSHLLPHSCRILSWPPVPTCQARQPSTIFWFLKRVREPHFPEVQPWLLGGCALLCPKMLQGAS